MTIKELEETLGMTRANIRFYEQEGLLSPVRSENGYRDYSQTDVETLRKIKLLRRLQVDLETIRKLQSGEVTLPDALTKQLEALEQDQAALDRAREVCARLEQSGTDYAGLDPAPWLEELDRAPASERFAPPKDELPPPPGHPWQRYFARSLDLALYSLPLTALWYLVLHLPQSVTGHTLFRLLDLYLTYALMLAIEPHLLHRWGTTPGKAILGITVRDSNGDLLTFDAALTRTLSVFGRGMGWGIPFYHLYRSWKSYRTCADGERCEWETETLWDCREGYRAELMTVPENVPRYFAWIGASLVLFALTFLIVAQSMLPPNRAPLDLNGFRVNYNFYNTQLGRVTGALGPDGRPAQEEGPVVIVDLFGTAETAQWSPITENGETVGFRYTRDLTGGMFVSGYALDAQTLGLLAFAGSLPGMNGFTFRPDRWVKQIPQDRWEYDFTYRGVRVTQTAVFQNGSHPAGGSVWLGEGQKATLALEFTVALADSLP